MSTFAIRTRYFRLLAALLLASIASPKFASAQADAQQVKANPKPAVPVAADRKQKQVLSTIETDAYVAKLSNLNGGLVSFKLKDARYQKGGAPIDMVTTDREAYLPLSIELMGVEVPEAALWRAEKLPKGGVRMTLDADGVRVTRKYEVGQGPYQLWLTTTIQNNGARVRKVAVKTKTFHYALRSDEKSAIPFLPVRSPWMSQGLCYHDDEVTREDRSALVDEPVAAKKVTFAGAENVYFLNAIAPHGEAAERCDLVASERGRDADGEALGTLFETSVSYQARTLAPAASTTLTEMAYLGPKTPEALAAAGHRLGESIDGGWFSALSKLLTLLLRMIFEVLGNWGLAIIVLTLIVKSALYPLTAKQMKSMAKMKELKPEMDRINELYADDRERKGAATMELYREKGVNPMAGCFPMLIQLPIWFSLYASLSTNIELLHAPFVGWLADLSSPDPYFVLPLALGVLMFVQQKMTPASGMDPAQQKMMLYMMPSMMMAFMLFLPAGLCLYMFTNSALSIGQQRLIEAQLTRLNSHAGTSSSPSSPPAQEPGTVATSGETVGRPRVTRMTKAERRLRRGR